MVRRGGLEPPRQSHTPLKRTRLPIPPPPRSSHIICMRRFHVKPFYKNCSTPTNSYIPRCASKNKNLAGKQFITAEKTLAYKRRNA